MQTRFFRVILAGLGIVLIAQFATAQSDPASRPSTVDSREISFPNGTWTINTYAAQGFQPASVVSDKTREDMTQLTYGLGYYFTNDVMFGMALTGSYTSQPVQNVIAGGGNIQVRGHFLDRPNFTLFGDTEMGILIANHHIPPGGTAFNYTVHLGMGATVRLSPTVNLIGGARYLHLSNADIDGDHRNPSINGAEGYLGVVIKIW